MQKGGVLYSSPPSPSPPFDLNKPCLMPDTCLVLCQVLPFYLHEFHNSARKQQKSVPSLKRVLKKTLLLKSHFTMKERCLREVR